MTSRPLAVTFYCADQNPHRDRSLGITGYTRGLLTALTRRPDIKPRAVSSTSSFRVPPTVPICRLPFGTDTAPGRLIADHLHPLLVRREPADLWHYPKGYLPLVARLRAPAAATIHDTILQHYADHYPHTRSRLDFAYWLHLLKRSIARADLVLTISEFSKRSILQFAERHGVNCPRIEVTFLGVQFEEADPTERSDKGDYVLHLASPLPHKRTAWLLETWRQLQAAGRNLPRLHIIGRLDAAAAATLSSLRDTTLSAPAEPEKLRSALARARAIILPSEIEGFGLPALEAYCLGTPVAFAAQTAVEEVIGGGIAGAFLFESESFESALRAVLELSPPEVNARAGELRQRFAWDKCAARTVAAYRTIV